MKKENKEFTFEGKRNKIKNIPSKEKIRGFDPIKLLDEKIKYLKEKLENEKLPELTQAIILSEEELNELANKHLGEGLI